MGLAGAALLPYRLYFVLLVILWTAAVAASLIYDLRQDREDLRFTASETARALLEKDMLYREWSLLSGGVYVPYDTNTPAPAREARLFVTDSGLQLVRVNPAVVSRQIFERQGRKDDIWGHLTSLKPIRSANGPDPWERAALEAFDARKVTEMSGLETRDGEVYFRMMRPLVITKACLTCHEEADRVPGEIRGGISVTAPLKRFAPSGVTSRLVTAHAGFWVVGLLGLTLGTHHVRKNVLARQAAEAERERLINELQAALANVKTLHGLIPMCSVCKKIRDDQGYWTKLEEYLEKHSEAEFSHGLCLDCLRRLYPEQAQEVEAGIARLKTKPQSPGHKDL